MYLVWDGFKSLLVAVLALLICGLPAFAVGVTILGRDLPGWSVWPVGMASGLLTLAGLVLTSAFLRKAWSGISPLRDRRR